MGRGSYHGGSTIINAWGGGWSRDASKSPTKKRVSRKPSFARQFPNYARACGLWSKRKKAWQEPPLSVREKFNNDSEAIKTAVLNSAEYQEGLRNKVRKAKAEKKLSRKKLNRIQEKLAKFASGCAVADFNKTKRPELAKVFHSEYGEAEAQKLLDNIHFTAQYKIKFQSLQNRVQKGKNIHTEKAHDKNVKQVLSKYIRNCAISDYNNKERPVVPPQLVAFFGESTLGEIIDHIELQARYKKTINFLEERAADKAKKK